MVKVVCSVTSGQKDLEGVDATVTVTNENVDKAEILVVHEPGAFTSYVCNYIHCYKFMRVGFLTWVKSTK